MDRLRDGFRPAVAGTAVLVACAAIVGGTAFLSAHHSFAAEFDVSAPVRLQGTLTRLEWTNPHVWIHMSVSGLDGQPETWTIETSSPAALARRGLRRDDLPISIDIVVLGYRAKNGTTTARGRELMLPGGRTVHLDISNGLQPFGLNR